MPIRAYNTVQTGPKTHVGGFQSGLRMLGYQLVTEPRDNRPLADPNRTQTTEQRRLFIKSVFIFE
jgi:hypothetical protein